MQMNRQISDCSREMDENAGFQLLKFMVKGIQEKLKKNVIDRWINGTVKRLSKKYEECYKEFCEGEGLEGNYLRNVDNGADAQIPALDDKGIC